MYIACTEQGRKTTAITHNYVARTGLPCDTLSGLLVDHMHEMTTGLYIIVRHALFKRFLCDLEDRWAVCRIPSKARVLLSPEVF